MEDLYYETEDLSQEFRSYRDGLRYDPQRLQEVEERLALLYRLKKKYGPDEEAILAYRTQAEAEIEVLSNAEENRGKLASEIAALEKDIASRAAAISAKRNAAAKRLGEEISAILTKLGMPSARFAVSVAPKEPRQAEAGPAERRAGGPEETGLPREKGSGGLVCGPWGADEVEFLISANTGEPLKDLSRIASGGELSRIMLAIKTVLAGADTLETLVFDEIDTGIGGEVALAVGEYLAKMGELKQIFCVTHLASIAVRADNHLKVEKKTSAGRTITTVELLRPGERRKEIARMLAGGSGAAALAHADELLAKYGKGGGG
jgi:DNA repair protein RecN (Recombination protein N)